MKSTVGASHTKLNDSESRSADLSTLAGNYGFVVIALCAVLTIAGHSSSADSVQAGPGPACRFGSWKRVGEDAGEESKREKSLQFG